MTTSFAQDELYFQSRERENAQKMVKAVYANGLLSGSVYEALIRIAEDGGTSAYVVYGVLAYFAVQEPIGSKFHNIRRIPTIVGYQSGRVHT